MRILQSTTQPHPPHSPIHVRQDSSAAAEALEFVAGKLLSGLGGMAADRLLNYIFGDYAVDKNIANLSKKLDELRKDVIKLADEVENGFKNTNYTVSAQEYEKARKKLISLEQRVRLAIDTNNPIDKEGLKSFLSYLSDDGFLALADELLQSFLGADYTLELPFTSESQRKALKEQSEKHFDSKTRNRIASSAFINKNLTSTQFSIHVEIIYCATGVRHIGRRQGPVYNVNLLSRFTEWKLATPNPLDELIKGYYRHVLLVASDLARLSLLVEAVYYALGDETAKELLATNQKVVDYKKFFTDGGVARLAFPSISKALEREVPELLSLYFDLQDITYNYRVAIIKEQGNKILEGTNDINARAIKRAPIAHLWEYNIKKKVYCDHPLENLRAGNFNQWWSIRRITKESLRDGAVDDKLLHNFETPSELYVFFHPWCYNTTTLHPDSTIPSWYTLAVAAIRTDPNIIFDGNRDVDEIDFVRADTDKRGWWRILVMRVKGGDPEVKLLFQNAYNGNVLSGDSTLESDSNRQMNADGKPNGSDDKMRWYILKYSELKDLKEK